MKLANSKKFMGTKNSHRVYSCLCKKWRHETYDKISKNVLDHNHDLIHKATGWALRNGSGIFRSFINF